MKLNRKVCIGFRNIGSAADPGEYYEGTLAEAIKWMIQKCQSMTISKRFSIAIARNMDECKIQFESTSRISGIDTSFSDVLAMLDLQESDDDDSQDDPAQPSASGEVALRDPLDTWKGDS